jgi:hypothetical protein
MEPVSFVSNESYELDDPGMYGLEQILVMKHTFPVGHSVIRGALVRDHAGGQTFFVTEADLARYRVTPQPPDLDA